jgi:hypothetical protein
MFSLIRKAKILIPFFHQRLSDYAELARFDLITFRNEMIGSIVGAAVWAAALLLLFCFICVALIVTEWDTPNRIRTAWMIASAWGLITGACAYLAHFLMKGTSPFENIGAEISLDLSVIKSPTAAFMTEPLPQLLEKMRASRGALAHQLDQIPARRGPRATLAQKPSGTPQTISVVVGVALAIAVLFPWRRGR